MARRTPSNKRKQREKKWIEDQMEGNKPERREATSAYYVLDMLTGEKTPGLSLKQAKTLWRSLEKACYFYMDSYTPGVAPLKAVYLKGPIPE